MPSARADIVIRPARVEELANLSALCLRSKALWGYDDSFIEACRAELTLTAADLAATHVRVAVADGVPVGFVQIAGKSMEKLFVEPSRIGNGVGRALFDAALALARAAGMTELVIEADPYAVDFYERMGARHAGNVPSGSIPGRFLPRLVVSVGRGS
ncbi:putative N-acetyltransferase YjaB [Defluviimonas aquaemixtae]|uniref:Putative N-acetyltransferase YjaB n=1 Tax=Albidovulum aquaemixtae TaxID=1542388 RepID=A0A2R8B262_9RHOB|nr:GNAT family N-acetyltransferase [Defluviimonas aquaemixtae]SPH16729.1 putative N-acetyltransferase YjaB [Defluviimonas aquaemixtae]